MTSYRLYCRSCYIGSVLLTVPVSEPVRLEIHCRHSKCKKAGVFPDHVFVITETTDPARVRPVESVYHNPGLPTELIGRPEE